MNAKRSWVFRILLVTTMAASLPGCNRLSVEGAGPWGDANDVNRARDAYRFVLQHEERSQCLPCFCGCENLEHRSLRDCFISGTGRDAKWSAHGAICGICIEVARSAAALTAKNVPVADMRERIVKEYGEKTGLTTATAAVPACFKNH